MVTSMDFQPKPTKRFWVAKPIYNPITIGFEPKADYWTVGIFAPVNQLSVGFPPIELSPNTILSGLRLSHEVAAKLADLFEKERLSATSGNRPAYYQWILRRLFRMDNQFSKEVL